jgi:Ca-activated chloride channel family protein
MSKRVRIYRFLIPAVTAFVLLATSRPVAADGFIIPEPPPRPEPIALRDTWLTIRYHRVTVSIDNQVAVTRVEQEFVNEHDWEVEGTYVFPLPHGASVSRFTMWVDGRPVEGEILEAGEARRIYEDIVRRRRDPALLEYVGRDAVRASIFPIPPGGLRRVELEYTQVLSLADGMVSYVYPLDTEKFSARPLEDCSIHVEIRSDDSMHAVYSPTHQDRVFIDRDGDHRATIGYEESDVLPAQDFELVYTVSEEDVGLNLLTYAESPNEGFFLLLVAPNVEVEKEQVIPRDVLLVLDTSGSMEGEKLAQAKDAVTFVLQHLNEEDRFNVVAFSTGLSRYALRLRPTSEASQAVAWVQDLEAIGGTNINRALLEAMALSNGQRSAVLIFLTDGLPTEGVTEIDQILANVESAAPDNLRVFAFGVGNDVNTVLLDTLAQQNRGATGYVRPHERIDEEVSTFYAKIRTPVLADLELDFDNILVEDVYPYPLPDLFAGSQLIVAGRYRPPSSTNTLSRITLSGSVDGRRRQFVYQGSFRAVGADDALSPSTTSFIPRLWATRKIGHLLTQIRLRGETREWVDAVVDLSIRYGIVTPYTSFLVEEEDILTDAGRERAAESYMATPAPAASGAPAVEMAEEEAKMRGADSAAPTDGGEASRTGEGMEPTVRHVGSKAFVLHDGVWIDTAFDPDTMSAQHIALGSQAYFDLLATRPAWGKYLALGERLIFVADSGTTLTAYKIEEGGGGETLPVLPTATFEPPQPTDAPVHPISVTATPTDGNDSLPSPRNGLCPGALLASSVSLAAFMVWESRRAR